jgi:hypothetical protein
MENLDWVLIPLFEIISHQLALHNACSLYSFVEKLGHIIWKQQESVYIWLVYSDILGRPIAQAVRPWLLTLEPRV